MFGVYMIEQHTTDELRGGAGRQGDKETMMINSLGLNSAFVLLLITISLRFIFILINFEFVSRIFLRSISRATAPRSHPMSTIQSWCQGG